MKRHGMKTRSRRGRLSVRKTRSRRKTPRKCKCKQRGGNFIQSTLGIPGGAYVTKPDPEEYESAPVLISNEKGIAAQEVA